MTRTLQMIFRNAENRNVTISLTDPVEELESEAVEAVMEEILDANIFQTAGGDIVGKVRAQVVSREVETITEF